MERKSTYSSSAPTKSSFLEGYGSGKAKADLENAMGVELPPAVDFSVYKALKQGNTLPEPKSMGLAKNPDILRNSNPHDSLKEVDLGYANVAQDDAMKLLREYALSFKRQG
jgi:hypothetical protein